MVNYFVVGIVVVLLVLVGYFSLTYIHFGVKDPKEMLKSYNEKFKHTKKLKLSYLLKVPPAETFYPTLSKGMVIEFYKLDQDIKFLIKGEGGTLAIYLKNGKKVSCTETDLFGSTVDCDVVGKAEMFVPVNDSLINQSEVSYRGVKKIAKRGCDDFLITLNESQLASILNLEIPLIVGSEEFGSLSNTTPQNKTFLMVELCMDKQYGYVALMNISMKSYSVLSRKSITRNLLSVEVTEMSTQVMPEDLKVPIAFILENVECAQNSINFSLISFRDVQNPTLYLTVSSSSQTVSTTKKVDSLKEGKEYFFNLTLPQQLSEEFYLARVCIGNSCQSDYCFISSPSPSLEQPSGEVECYSHSDCWYTNYSKGCCLGQCNFTTHRCYSSPQSADYTAYGQEYYCTGGQVCGNDCKCH